MNAQIQKELRNVKRTGCGKKGVSVFPALSDEERDQRRRETIKKAQKKYRDANRERRNAEQRKRRDTDSARIKNAERMRNYRLKNKDKFAVYESRRVRPDDYREKLRKYTVVWSLSNGKKDPVKFMQERGMLL